MQIYLVGGAVRDTLLGREVTERDYVVVGATDKEMLALGYQQVGSDFPVFLHPKTGEEYALARTERKSGKGYLGFECDASKEVTLEEDLLRRDLTVNAMAFDTDGTLIDPYGGEADLNNRSLRHVSNAFSEDPLRVFRVARFAARYHYLGFSIAAETLSLMANMAQSGELMHLSAERVWQETKRSLLEQNPEVYFNTLQITHSLNSWFSGLEEESVGYQLGIAALAYACKNHFSEEKDIEVAIKFSLLCHSLTTEAAKTMTAQLKCPNSVSDLLVLVTEHLATLIDPRSSAIDILAVFNKADLWRRKERFDALLKCCDIIAQTKRLDGWEQYRHALIKGAEASSQVNVQAIIQQGFKGAQIKEQLNKSRVAAITLALHSDV
ncbi:CCA tRNA nucleotidyltransferase [Alteromonas sp. KUL49]|uniref:CCA tRNA nucleotidyltransferase n=1 Tax=Alteromonas sp. KUL49 TaxID=2480798 RepID=UPI00102ED667|nr:CCA tRNA nucleotidyltransferase [Alteromonas sp. KUL49]TAP38807.1 CCA tRNA nucleotidyltransferase [Alteromonas sp. KUL49]GEA12237.1 multifunctional CCA protein [Alteromonas sp. KUL49]